MLTELLIKTPDEIEKTPIDKVTIEQIEKAMMTASSEDKIKLQAILKRKKTLIILDKGIKEIEDLDEPTFD